MFDLKKTSARLIIYIFEFGLFSKFVFTLYSFFFKDKLKWVPMPYYYVENISQIDWDSFEYDIFFYGHPNERRKNIIDGG